MSLFYKIFKIPKTYEDIEKKLLEEDIKKVRIEAEEIFDPRASSAMDMAYISVHYKWKEDGTVQKYSIRQSSNSSPIIIDNNWARRKFYEHIDNIKDNGIEVILE